MLRARDDVLNSGVIELQCLIYGPSLSRECLCKTALFDCRPFHNASTVYAVHTTEEIISSQSIKPDL